jgi:cysteine desulfurase
MTSTIYLDHNSTTPVDAEVLDAMLPYLCEQFGNPSSGHQLGRSARVAVDRARSQVAALIGARAGKVIFTSGATESNNLALKGIVAKIPKCHVITTTIEHKSVLAPLRSLEEAGRIELSWLSPDSQGQVHGDPLRRSLRPDTRLVSVIAAHNVIHTINPLEDLLSACSDTGILFHSDATQLVGRAPLNVENLGVDALTFSAHKLYGPKGAGALYLGPLATRLGVAPLIEGGGQEKGIRSGTLNVPAIVGFGAACALAECRLREDAVRARELADLLLAELRRSIPNLVLNGHTSERLPGGLHVTIPGIDNKALAAAVPQVAFSTGSACDSEDEKNNVLREIGRPEALHWSVRFQIGRTTTRQEILQSAQALLEGIRQVTSLGVIAC